MTILEKIVNELTTASDPLLVQVLDLIQSAKEKTNSVSSSSNLPRTPGLHRGEIIDVDALNENRRIPGQDKGLVIIHADFEDPLPSDILDTFYNPADPC